MCQVIPFIVSLSVYRGKYIRCEVFLKVRGDIHLIFSTNALCLASFELTLDSYSHLVQGRLRPKTRSSVKSAHYNMVYILRMFYTTNARALLDQ